MIPASTRMDRRPGQPSVNAVTSVSPVRPNGAKALLDKHRDVGVSLGDCSEHLPTSTRSFDIADANLHVTFALFAAADERQIHADSDQCCRSCWLVNGCNSKLRADPQRMVAQCHRATLPRLVSHRNADPARGADSRRVADRQSRQDESKVRNRRRGRTSALAHLEWQGEECQAQHRPSPQGHACLQGRTRPTREERAFAQTVARTA